MRLTKKLLGNQTGDTIIEVLLSIAVVSSMLSGAYVVTNKSLVSSREAQERSAALKLTESQFERLRSLAKTSPALVFDGSTTFCIKPDNTLAAIDSEDCKVDASGSPTTKQPSYSLSVSRDDASNVFTAQTEWARMSASGTNTVKMVYKVYEQ
jgi:Tfp pilus assembly protein PilV